MVGELTWGLGASAGYTVGEVLSTPVKIVAPEAGTYYIVGALYSVELAMYSGTFFGLLQTPDTVIVSINPATLSVWSFEEDEELDFTAEFSLTTTGCILAIFLYRLTGDIPELEDDVMISSVQALLISPIAQAIEDRNMLFNGLLGAVVLAAMFPVLTNIGRQK